MPNMILLNHMKKIIVGAVAFFAPIAVFAQNSTQLFSILGIIKSVLNFLIPICITLGVVYFIWAVIQYVTVKDEEERAKSKTHMIYGLIGLFVIVSIWGLVGFLGTTVGISQGGTVALPTVN